VIGQRDCGDNVIHISTLPKNGESVKGGYSPSVLRK
jgi:hypothetical protein